MFTFLFSIIAFILAIPIPLFLCYRKYVEHKKMIGGVSPLFSFFMGVVITALIVITNSFVVIEGSNYGVLKRFGKIQPVTLTPGLYWQTPYMDKIELWGGAMRKLSESNDSASSDLQQATVTWVAAWQYVPSMIPRIAEKTGPDSGPLLIAPAINETLKAVTAMYKAEELITQREQVRHRVIDSIRKRMMPYGIQVNEFNITNFKFGDRFSEAVEAKTEAEQLVLKTKQDYERTKIEMEQKVARAEAEAKALKLQREAITPELLELRKIERDLKAIEKWDGVLPKITSNATPFVDIATLK